MKKYLSIVLLWLCFSLNAQEIGIGGSMPKISRPEASVSSLMAFEEIPVSPYTGIPEVNVPLFNLPTRSKNIGLNLFLAYHPSSVMKDEIAGDCGLGWSLFSGGVISRTVISKPDELVNGYNEPDGADIYQFNFYGHVGRFYITKVGNELELKVIENFNSKLLFNLNYNQTTFEINSITAFDEKGLKFVFNTIDKQVHKENVSSNDKLYNGAFHLTKVFDNNNQELLSFSYLEYTEQVFQSNLTNKFQKVSELTSLGFGKVKVNYNTGNNFNYNTSIRINNFELFDLQNVSRKKVKLYFQSGIHLSKVEALSPDETIKEDYSFLYDYSIPLDYGIIADDNWGYKKFVPDCLYAFPVENLDHPIHIKHITQGVLNEMKLPTGGIVKFNYEANTYTLQNYLGQIDNEPSSYADLTLEKLENINVEVFQSRFFSGGRGSSHTFTVPGTGNNPITYYLHFWAQPYTDADLGLLGSGSNNVYYPFLKIQGTGFQSGSNGNSGVNYDENQNKLNFCLGRELLLYPGQTYTISIEAPMDHLKFGYYQVTKWEPKSNLKLHLHGAGIRIKDISYFEKNNFVPVKITNYNYNFFDNPSRSSGVVSSPNWDEYSNQKIKREPVGYKNVTVYETGKGRQEFTYTTPADFNYTPYASPLNTSYYDYRRGQLLKSRVYHENGNLLVENNFDYQFLEPALPLVSNVRPTFTERIGWAKLTSRSTKQFFENSTNPLETNETFEYNDNIRKVIKHTTSNSLGETIETNTIYHTGNSIFSQNRIAELEEINVKKNGETIATSKIIYSNNWGTGTNQSFLPSSFVGAKANQSLYTKSYITNYDQFSNPTEIKEENGVFTTYIWGYNKTQVIAQIINASNAQVAAALGVANVHVLNENNLTSINNLRTNSAFNNAFVTTATYIPLVGVSTITDALGDTIKYEYDAMNRLKLVRDKSNNIVSESNYFIDPNGMLNHVLNTTYKVATNTSLAAPSINQASQSVVFIDGLGRPVQEISHRQSNSGKDIVQHIEYDSNGRKSKSYLPYVNQTASLSFNQNAKDAVLNYPDYVGKYPYSEVLMESSPLQRVIEQASPGEDWHLNSLVKHTKRFDYLLNSTLDEVKIFKAVANESTFNSNGVFDISLQQNGFYTEDKLFKNVVKNENWVPADGNKNTTHQFTDTEGKVILIRTFGESVNSNGQEIFDKHDTYYVYDQYGNLTYMIPPKADGNITEEVLNNLCYQYKYDHKNRLVEKKLPGKDSWEFIVYDKRDRIVAVGPSYSPFTNAAENTTGWLIAKYDAINRKILTAWMLGTTDSNGRNSLQSIYNSQSSNLLNEQKSTSNSTVNGVVFRYTNVAYPTTGFHVLTINYFDDYNFPNAPTSFSFTMHNNSQPVFYNNSTQKPKGLATGNWVRVLETNNDTNAETSHILYDFKARAIRTRKNNYLGGYTQVDASIDFSGKTIYSEIKHRRINTSAEIYIRENFEYTPQDRLRKHTHQIGTAGAVEMLAFYEYNELGQLLNKRVGGANSASPTGLQKIDFTYNIRGWLTEINNINQLNQAGAPKDLFAYKLNYNTVQNENGYTGKAQFNGNISEIYWRSDSDNQLRKYGYQYDDLNRLKQAIFQMPGATIAVPETYNESLKYDKNGNITELIRRGRDISNSQTITIDHLVYNYQNHSNKVIKITDLTNNSLGFHDGTNQAVEYFYDILGNLTRDLNKEIGTTSQNGIRYNHLNLPNQITKGSNNASYWYNATGQKMKKVVVHNGVNTTTDYLDGFQYKNGVLEFFGHAEGYVASNKYFYQYKDQLGNIRMTFTANASGIATIVEENHYYPYGLKHSGYGTNATIANDAHKYRYNSREWQNELDLNYTAMDFRLYDNAVGRFWCMDALSEKYHYISPYHFGNNNPVFWSDPSGLSATSSEFTHDFMGRARFDKYGMFIPPFERQYKSITTDGGNGEGSGGGGGPMFETVDEILNHMLKYMKDKPGINSLTYKPGDGFYYYEQYSVVDKHKYKWNDETQQYDLGGAGMKLKKVYVYVDNTTDAQSGGGGIGTAILDGVQTVLDVVGLIPGVGEIADGVNALIYTGRGDYVNAGLSAAAMIPFAGWAATGGKFANKAVKYHNRVDAATDLYHTFPRSFDSHIMQNGAWSQRIKDGANWFELPGTINGTNGMYQIGINNSNVIFHRNFVPFK